MLNSPEKQEAAQVAWQAVVQSRLGNLPHGAPNDRASLTELAEIEIKAMREGLARALELRNATASPACRLPQETLANVFSYVQALWPTRLRRDEGVNPSDDPDADDDPEPFYFTKGWYTVAHVCHLWREAAHTPPLWCTIACADLPPEFLPVVLSRTRGLPLTLTIRSLPLGDNASEMLKSMWRARLMEGLLAWFSAAILRRVERFIFEARFSQDDFALCRPCLHHPMPALKSLAILSDTQSDPPSHIRLRRLPFGTHVYPLSSLRHLSISNCDIHESAARALLTSNITHLTVNNLTGDQYLIETFYPSLASMILLEELTLVNFFPKETDYLESPNTLLLPSSLRMIQLLADFDTSNPDALNDCLRFASHLTISSTAHALIKIRDKDMSMDDEDTEEEDPITVDQTLLDATLSAFFVADDPVNDSRELNISYEAYNIHSAPASPFLPPRSYPQTCPGGRSFSLGCLCRHCPIESTLLDHIKPLPLLTLRSISLQMSTWRIPVGTDGWKSLLPAADVRRLSVEWTSWHCHELWDAMSVPMADSSVLFPALETLIIHDNFSAESDRYFWRLAGTLIDMLHTRKDHHVGVCDVLVDEKLKHWSIWSLVAEVTSVTFFTPAPSGQ